MFKGRSILVTGGTGSFGKQFIEAALKQGPRRLVIFSRDELKQFEMSQEARFSTQQAKETLRYFIGDVRDYSRLSRAFDGVDIVVHAAALKQVPACEYNPFEAIQTNVIGAQNIIDVSIDRGVSRVLALSTDKACNPVNLYGATKLCSDKLFVAGNAYAGDKGTRFAVVRYGNVVGSRGSVVPLFLKQRATGRFTITHAEMTRFWITLPQGVEFVMDSLERMSGGEIFVPKIPSMRLTELARAIGPECVIEEIGIRPGEKLHEMMISEDDARQTLEFDKYYVIQPQFAWWATRSEAMREQGRPVEEGFSYNSKDNKQWLSAEALGEIVRPIEEALR